MKHKIIIILLFTVLTVNLVAEKYAGEIFRMGAGVENFALGNTGLTNANNSALAYWNPAFLANISQNSFEIMHAEEYMGLLTYDVAAYIFGKQAKCSVVLTRIGIDDIPLTAWNETTNRPYEYKNVNNSDLSLFVGIHRKLLGLNLGFTPKVAYRSLAEESGFGFGLDVSTYYQLSDNLMLAAKIRDLFTTQIIWTTGTQESVLPGLDMEASYNFILPIFKKSSKLIGAIEIYSEDRDFAATNSFGIFSTDYHFGFSTQVHPQADLLLGYDVNNLTAGIKIKIKKWFINYGFKQNSELENSHRISLELKI